MSACTVGVIKDTHLRARRYTFIQPHENDKCVYMHRAHTAHLHTHHRRVALCKRSKRPTDQPPADQPASRLYYYAVAPCNSRGPELNVRKARRHYRAEHGVPLIFRSARPRVIILANPTAGPHEDITRKVPTRRNVRTL